MSSLEIQWLAPWKAHFNKQHLLVHSWCNAMSMSGNYYTPHITTPTSWTILLCCEESVVGNCIFCSSLLINTSSWAWYCILWVTLQHVQRLAWPLPLRWKQSCQIPLLYSVLAHAACMGWLLCSITFISATGRHTWSGPLMANTYISASFFAFLALRSGAIFVWLFSNVETSRFKRRVCQRVGTWKLQCYRNTARP